MTAKGKILVVGGGISGITAAVEAAEVGYDVHLVERTPFLGGRVSRLNQYFPKLCPPYCGLEINFKRIRSNPHVTTHTLAQVKKIEGGPGAYKVTLELAPRFVDDKCTACNACVEACPEERESDFDYGLKKTKAVYLPHQLAMPMLYAIDEKACKGEACGKCVEACTYGAIDLTAKKRTETLEVGAIVVATGWKPYDVSKLENLGAGKLEDVVTNVELERLAAENGPTAGKVVRPSDGKEIESVAFVQCAGSRDDNHLPFCSGVCCLASLKQATYVRERYPQAAVHIFYIDIRSPGRNEDFFAKVAADDRVSLHKGKVAAIERTAEGKLAVEAEDTATGVKSKQTVDMVVLATGMQPEASDRTLPGAVEIDEYGFVVGGAGIFGAGCARNALDVAASVKDGTGAALKAIQTIVGRAR